MPIPSKSPYSIWTGGFQSLIDAYGLLFDVEPDKEPENRINNNNNKYENENEDFNNTTEKNPLPPMAIWRSRAHGVLVIWSPQTRLPSYIKDTLKSKKIFPLVEPCSENGDHVYEDLLSLFKKHCVPGRVRPTVSQTQFLLCFYLIAHPSLHDTFNQERSRKAEKV